MAPHLAWYLYGMDSRHDAPHSPASPEIASLTHPAKTIFDGTKLRLEPSRRKTTTDGINRRFRLNSMDQNCAIRTPTLAPESSLFATTVRKPRLFDVR